MLRWVLKITGPSNAGRKLWRNNVMATPENRTWLKKDLYACGLRLERLSELPANLDRLLDIRLEGMSGLDLFRRLAAQETHPPVIFITAHDDPKMRDEAETLGCAGFFRKTSPGTEIIDAIRRVSSPGGCGEGEREE